MQLMLDCSLSMIQKILSQDELLGLRQTMRAAGKILVFTNGVFDLLHVGHLRYLEAARALGDVLVVAVNSDRSVRAIKESGRPILTENERVALVSALSAVDYVVVFDEPDVRRVIEILRPAVHAKGTDYT